MSHGRPGDNPITDVLFHNATYYTPEIRELFKEVYALSNKKFIVFSDIDLYADSDEIIQGKLLALKEKLSED